MSSIGLNISGGEFNGTGGEPNVQYYYPSLSLLQYYNSKGVDFIRLPVGWERLQPSLGGPLDVASDIALIKKVLVDAASLGMNVVIDLHNYGRYNGLAIGQAGGPTVAQFADFWQKMATEMKGYPALVGYDLMNEPHDMPVAGIWKAAAQAATDAIRTVDTKSVVYVEGDGWSSTHTWVSNNNDLIINDPANRLVYTAHGYYDHWNEGAYRYSYDGEGAYPNIGVDRLKPFVDWLNAHGFKGMVGEFGVPSTDPRWLEVQKNALNYMIANNLEATAWGGGAYGTGYNLYTAQPGSPDSAYMDVLEPYFTKYSDPFAVTTPTAGVPSVAVNDVTVNEPDGVMIFTVTRTGDLSAASSVNYGTGNGTASAGSDYTAASGTLSFAAGQATATVRVAVTNDTLVENPETLTLNLTNGVNATIADGQGVGTIVSEDASTSTGVPAGFPTAPTITGTSGNDSINADSSRVDHVDAGGGDDFVIGVGSADYINGGAGIDTVSYHWSGARVDVDLLRTYQQNGDANGDVLVNVENISGSGLGDVLRGDNGANALNGLGGLDTLSGRGGADTFVFNSAADANGDVITDYSAEDRLDFSAFNPKFLSITNDGANTRVVGDVNNDGIGDFTVTLNGVYTSVNGVTVGSVTPPPSTAPSVAINDVTVNEAAGSVAFTITRSGSLTSASSVNYVTGNGTATAGSDYTAISGTVSFAAGETTKTVTVQVINDTLVESAETFTVNLSGGTNVAIADAQGIGTIISDDVATTPTVPAGFPTAPTITGTSGNDSINADSSKVDHVDAGAGDDYIIGVGSADYINGGAGSDTVSFHWSGARVDVDLLRSSQLYGDAHGDVLVGVENISGSRFGDTLRGDNGNNVLNGLGGQDVLSGRGGNDTFVFSSAADANGDVITDYSAGDRLDFSAFNPKFLSITNDGVNTRLAGDANGDGAADFTVVLNGVHTSVSGVVLVGAASAASPDIFL